MVRPGARGSAAQRRTLELAAGADAAVRRGYTGRLTLAEIALDVGCSPFHLSRAVRAATGLSLHQVLVRYRLRHALELVLDSRLGLSAIAYSTGFSSHSHLTDTFRRELGCSPSAVRRRPPGQIRSLLRRSGRA